MQQPLKRNNAFHFLEIGFARVKRHLLDRFNLFHAQKGSGAV